MRRMLALAVLVGFLVYTGTYVFVYLFRAFRLEEPGRATAVHIWHGDPMIRAVLVAVLFAIGLLLLLFVFVARPARTQREAVRLRHDLASWLEERSAATGDTADAIADRAVAAYRAAIEEGRPVRRS